MLRAELLVPELLRGLTRPLASVVPRPMSWVWEDWIPRGSLSLALGEPGVGKSLYALQLAAMVTRGYSTMQLSDNPQSADRNLAETAAPNVPSGASPSSPPSGETSPSAAPPDGTSLSGTPPGDTSPGGTSPGGTSLSPRRAWSSSHPISPSNINHALPPTAHPQVTPFATTRTPGTVVLFDPSEGVSILRSRLDAAGADVEKIVLIERNWRGDSGDDEEEFLQSQLRQPPARRPTLSDKDRELRRDLESLEQHVVQLRQAGHDVSLVIIDPIESLLRDSLDKHRLARLLSELADSLNVAIVAVGTIAAKPREFPGLRLDRHGIDALFQQSRTVVSIVRDVDHEQQRIVQPIKVNLSTTPIGLTLTFAQDGSLEWSQSTTTMTDPAEVAQADQQLEMPSEPEPPEELNRAIQWLKQRLKAGGVPVNMIRSDAREQQISKESLGAAYEQLGCVNKKARKSGQWLWRMPPSTEHPGNSATHSHDAAQSQHVSHQTQEAGLELNK